MLGVARGDEPRQAQHGGGNRQKGFAFKNGKTPANQTDKAEPSHYPLADKAAMLGAGHREFVSHTLYATPRG